MNEMKIVDGVEFPKQVYYAFTKVMGLPSLYESWGPTWYQQVMSGHLESFYRGWEQHRELGTYVPDLNFEDIAGEIMACLEAHGATIVDDGAPNTICLKNGEEALPSLLKDALRVKD